MKVAFDHQIFAWQKYGGISRYMAELAGQLTSVCKQNVAIFAPFYINSYIKHLPNEVRLFGVRVPAFKYCGRIYRPINYWIARLCIHLFKPDIIHETYFSSIGIFKGNAKIILTVYDMIDEIFSEPQSPSSVACKEKLSAVKRADHIICISESTRRDLIRLLNVPIKKTSVVHLGFSLTRDSESSSDLISNLNNTSSFILYVGNRNGHKNFRGLLHAYAQSDFLKNKYKLICFGGGRFSASEISLIQELDLKLDNVQQVSGSDAALGAYYKLAKVFVYPSLYEGFGIPPLEAMSFNCPVVCSNTSSMPEVVGDAALMFDPKDCESIKVAIERVVENEELRGDLVNRGRNRVQFFSWEKCAEETFEVYKSVRS